MVSRQLQKFADRYNWKNHNDTNDVISVFGEFNGFLFTAIEGQGFKSFFTSVAGIGQAQLVNLKSWIEQNRKSIKMRNYELSDNFLCIRLNEEWFPLSPEKLESFLIRLTGMLDELNLPEKGCAICGQPANKRGLYVGLFCFLHPECQDSPGINFTSANDIDNRDDKLVPAEETIAELAASMNNWRSQMIDTVINLCSIPSVKGDSENDAPYGRQTAEVLKSFLDIGEALGFSVVNLENRAGYIEWGQGEDMVAALCHLDVVPAGQGWHNDPFQPALINGRIAARGTVDDKGPASAVLYAMKALKEEGYVPACRLRLIVGLDEENGSGCMEWYRLNQELPVAGFTADASFPVIHAEKGIVHLILKIDEKQDESDSLLLKSAYAGEAANMVPGSFRADFFDNNSLEISGRQAHASRPESGENAIIKGIYDLQRQLDAASSHHPFVSAFTSLFPENMPGEVIDFLLSDEYGDLTVNPGILELDSSGACLTLDIRYPVTCDFEDDLKKPFENLVTQYGFSCHWNMHQEPLFIDPESPLISTLNHIYKTMTNTQVEPEAIGGGTYARAIPNIAAFGPAFPGDPDVCHQSDESIDIDRLLAAAAIYKEALQALSS